ncbi:MAG: 50S ribosomal protein L30 [candidate division WOR-3 bacterium]|jgi:large subunit ribosomal protein L30|nr:50S ribosomal protein L30 [candidate division WOR-3 bacterium]
MPAKSKKLKVTLVRSLIDSKPVHKKNARALGLRRIGASRIHDDTPVIRGMIAKVSHLVEVKEVVDG